MVFLIISINFLESCEAPPIKKPSIVLIFFIWSILFEFTEPPYKIFGLFVPNLLLINKMDFIKSFGFGIIPKSSVGYLLESSDDSKTPKEVDRYEGDGGVNTAFLTFGFKIFKKNRFM